VACHKPPERKQHRPATFCLNGWWEAGAGKKGKPGIKSIKCPWIARRKYFLTSATHIIPPMISLSSKIWTPKSYPLSLAPSSHISWFLWAQEPVGSHTDMDTKLQGRTGILRKTYLLSWERNPGWIDSATGPNKESHGECLASCQLREPFWPGPSLCLCVLDGRNSPSPQRGTREGMHWSVSSHPPNHCYSTHAKWNIKE
jgi:hypothetical protein